MDPLLIFGLCDLAVVGYPLLVGRQARLLEIDAPLVHYFGYYLLIGLGFVSGQLLLEGVYEVLREDFV